MRLARDGNDVLYHVPWQRSYPTYAGYAPGEGFEGITKVRDLGKSIDEADVIVFTDIGQGPLASYLRRHGYSVFGAGDAELLEFDRAYAIERMTGLGIKTPSTKVVVGVDAALRALKDANGPRIVKLNIFRGDSETMHVPDYGAAQAMLNWIRGRLGPFDDDFVFLVQEPVDGVMVGVDTFFDGERFSSPRGLGIEIAADVVEKWEDASMFDAVLAKTKPMLQEMGYRGSLSIEAMYDGKDLYVIDWTCRFPWPLSIMYTDCIQNYSEVIAGVAKGKMPALKITKPYTALLSLQAFGIDSVTEPWLPIRADEGVRVKYRRAVKRDGQVYAVPGVEGESGVASVYGEGDTWKEAVEQASKGRGGVNIHNSYYYGEFADSADEQVKELAKKGVAF
jgi:phosphoribosylamine-glycine ligase